MNTRVHTIRSDEVNLLHAKMCRAVGDPKRIQILYALADSPHTVGVLAELLDSPQPTISRHLAILRESGMVTTQRSGTSIIYALEVPEMIELIESMRAILRTVIAREASSLEDDLSTE
jgi:DNA-binding transcriptional ArsR family regulator